MGVFDGQIQTPLAVADPTTDWMLPPPGALSYANIVADSALLGTNGHDCLLLAGDRDRQMNGNERTRVTENRSHDIGGNQHKQVVGNKDENIIGNFIHQTTGNLHRSVIGMTNDLYTGDHNQAHKADQKIQEPTSYWHDVKEHYVKNFTHHDEYQFYQLYANQITNVIGANVDFKLLQMAAIGGALEKAGMSLTEHLARIHDSAVDQRFEALDAKVGAIQPVVHVAMFHEVAFTQKIIVVGANQAI